MPGVVQGNRNLSMVINPLSRKCIYAQITIFHIILEVKSSLTHNLSYFYYSSPVLTGMTWQKPHYFPPIELVNCLTKSILATMFEGMKSYRDSIYNKTGIGKLSLRLISQQLWNGQLS